MKTRLVYNDKCKKFHTKPNQNQTKSIMQFTWIIFERNVMNVGPQPKPNLFCYELILINSIILELWKFIHLKKNLKMEVLKVKFEIWDFKNYLKMTFKKN